MSSKTSKPAALPTSHPLQRLASPSTTVSSLIHFLGLSSFATAFKYLVDFPTPINESYGWHFQYLTIIGLSLATITFACGSIADMTSSQTMFRVKNVLSICTTPLEVLIAVLYWSIRSIDKSLVFPEWAQLPLLADLSFHLFPPLFLAVDFLLLSPPWTISFQSALELSTAIAFGYWFWVEECYKHNGFYPYPIFDQVDLIGRIGLFILSAVVMAGSTMTLKRLYAIVNGRIMETLQEEQNKKKTKPFLIKKQT